MAGKAVISLSTGLEDPKKVTVAFPVAVGAAESGRPTLMFQAKEAVRDLDARERDGPVRADADVVDGRRAFREGRDRDEIVRPGEVGRDRRRLE